MSLLLWQSPAGGPLETSRQQPAGLCLAIGHAPGHPSPPPHCLITLAPPLRAARAASKPRCLDYLGRSRSGHAQWPGRWGRRETPGPARSRGAGASGKWAGAEGSVCRIAGGREALAW